MDKKTKAFHIGILEPFGFVLEVIALIHRITITTNYSYNRIIKAFGVNFPIHRINDKKSMYLYEGFFNYLGMKVHVLTGLTSKMWKVTNRLTQLSIVPDGIISPQEHKIVLLKFDELLSDGKVKVKEAELTYDIMFKVIHYVHMMFESLRKIIYIPNLTKASKIIVDGMQFRADKKLNCLIKYGDKTKLYERGPDNKRVKITYKDNGFLRKVKGWPVEGLDRVRIEYTLDRRKLNSLGIDTIGDFVSYRNNDGVNIMHQLIDFPQFREIVMGSHKANYNCLMSIVVQLKRKSNYVVPFNRLKTKLFRRKLNRAVYNHSKYWDESNL